MNTRFLALAYTIRGFIATGALSVAGVGLSVVLARMRRRAPAVV